MRGSPTRAPGADATGMRCARCDSGAVAAEVHTVRGVPGVLCGYCASCGYLWPVPRRAPTAAEASAPPRERRIVRRGACQDCGLPLGGTGTRCNHCDQLHRNAAARERTAERRAAAPTLEPVVRPGTVAPLPEVGPLEFGDVPPCLTRCEDCGQPIVWRVAGKRPARCGPCKRERERARGREKYHRGRTGGPT